MNKIKIKKPDSATMRGWPFVLLAGAVLALLALLDRGGFSIGATGVTGCVMRVDAAELNVRSTPGTELGPVRTLRQGNEVDAERIVTGGFRKLAGDGEWALDASLTPTTGSNC
ncbi:SH3 domain-containing protein [Pseudonocardia sp. H11422]|uniref:SH3 domain-containing protein n=1 Tax=Pseudonocardia sp. H11422 TaxID=2835866 RepID=UPI001BDBEC44|nr:SH3 domain-containing protein [Pseudonocardia sp. H11422]